MEMTMTFFASMKKTGLVLAIAAPAMAGSAYADCSPGFLANLTCEAGIIDEDTANTLDDVNAALGNPVDHAIAEGADVFLPGAGQAMEGYWELQRQMDDWRNIPIFR